MKAASNSTGKASAEKAASLEQSASEAASALEEAATAAVHRLAKAGREVQSAAFDETRAAMRVCEDMLKAGSLGDAAQVGFDYWRARADVCANRAKSAIDTLANAARGAAK